MDGAVLPSLQCPSRSCRDCRWATSPSPRSHPSSRVAPACLRGRKSCFLQLSIPGLGAARGLLSSFTVRLKCVTCAGALKCACPRRNGRRIPKIDDLMQLPEAIKAGLRREELIAIVLYTGPMVSDGFCTDVRFGCRSAIVRARLVFCAFTVDSIIGLLISRSQYTVYNAILRQWPQDLFEHFNEDKNLFPTSIFVLVQFCFTLQRDSELILSARATFFCLAQPPIHILCFYNLIDWILKSREGSAVPRTRTPLA